MCNKNIIIIIIIIIIGKLIKLITPHTIASLMLFSVHVY